MFAFFAVVNHLSRPLRKQKFTLLQRVQKVMVCDLRLVDFDLPYVGYIGMCRCEGSKIGYHFSGNWSVG